MRLFHCCILYFLVIMAQGQPVSPVKFIEYREFESAYQSGVDLSQLSRDFDFLRLLLLDSSRSQELFEFDPYLKELFEMYLPEKQPNDKTIGFVTNAGSVKEVFENERTLRKIVDCAYDETTVDILKWNFHYPIYLNENTAVFEIYAPFTSDLYIMRLLEGTDQINWLGGVME